MVVETHRTLKGLLSSIALAVAVASCAPTETTPIEGDGTEGEAQQAYAWRKSRPEDQVLRWNRIMLDANALDHTPPKPGENRVYGEQLGRPRTARAFAIVQIAVFDAFNAIVREYRSYTGIEDAERPASPSAAIAQAAHDTLAALYPSQSPKFDEELAEDLGAIPNTFAKHSGIDAGKRAAAAILALRQNDGSQIPDPIVGVSFFPSPLPGKWRPDPISQNPTALGAFWGEVKPFVIESADQFPIPPPPRLTSREYAIAFNEVKQLGGDGITTPTKRTKEQTIIGIYWAYDGTPKLGTPSRMSNQIATVIAKERRLDAIELARMFALTNVAEADAALTAWNEKYDVQHWRPITGVREADPGTGPTGLGDGNPLTRGDPNWTPLGSPASNTDGDPNFTPPFPSYTSGHATFAGAFFQVLRRFYRTDKIRFTFVSDEFNGITRDNMGRVRPRIPRTFRSLSDAEEEEGQSRIYLGVHWSYDKVRGIENGRSVGNWVYENAFRRRR
jgi:hypothetical protein